MHSSTTIFFIAVALGLSTARLFFNDIILIVTLTMQSKVSLRSLKAY